MKPAQLAVAKKTPTRTGKRGGQKGNSNALKSGVWATIARRNLDGRTALAKELQAAEQGLIEAVGGNPSPQQKLLIGRIVYKAWRCQPFEIASINGDSDEHSAASDACYLSWAGQVRQDLQALGIDGVEPPMTEEKMPLIRVVLVPAKPASEQTAPPRDESPKAYEGDTVEGAKASEQSGRPVIELRSDFRSVGRIT